jgi:helix-turn-helix protein
MAVAAAPFNLAELLSDPLITALEAAALLGLSPQTLAVWRCQRRHLDFVKCGRAVRYKVSVIKHFLEDRTYKGA